MKLKILNQILFTAITILLVSCATTEEISGSQPCGTYNGHQLYKRSNGDCYYDNLERITTYVDESYCNCNNL